MTFLKENMTIFGGKMVDSESTTMPITWVFDPVSYQGHTRQVKYAAPALATLEDAWINPDFAPHIAAAMPMMARSKSHLLWSLHGDAGC